MTCFPCAGCGKFAFPNADTLCYWCRDTRTADEQAACVAQGITHAVQTPPATREAIFEAERQRLHGPKKSLRKRTLT
jgi:hypothetical protein